MGEDDSSGFGERFQRVFAAGTEQHVQFTRLMLHQYDHRCAISGMDFPSEERLPHPHLDVLLLCPLSDGGALSFANALVLEENVAHAMRAGLIGVDAEFNTIVPCAAALPRALAPHVVAGRMLQLPADRMFWPSPENLAYHRRLTGL